MLKRLALSLLTALLALITVLAFNSLSLRPETLAAAPDPTPTTDAAAIQRLSAAIRIPSISTEAAPAPDTALDAFAAHLAASFPLTHAALKPEKIAGHSLLFTWPGSDPAAPALLLAAHQDVVPVEGAKWTRPPFSGAVDGRFVWGRGALDDKQSVMAILEATERLLASGFRPRQTIYLAFGHDEERAGSGAKAMAALLKARRVKIGLALDEGFAVLDGVVAGMQRPVALIGLAEKGYVSVELTATGPGGHSSMPGSDNAAVRIARAVGRLHDNPFPERVEGLTGRMLDALAPYATTPLRVAFSNRWLTGRLIARQLLASPDTAASIRTTTAVTILQAGEKDNVLPQSARAVVNHRILPGDTVASVLERDRAIVADPRVRLRALPGGHDPSQIASADGPDFARLKAAIRATYPNAAIGPGLVLGATDGRSYEGVARSVMRFTPVVFAKTDLTRFHGTDERIAIADYIRAIEFYERLIRSQ